MTTMIFRRRFLRMVGKTHVYIASAEISIKTRVQVLFQNVNIHTHTRKKNVAGQHAQQPESDKVSPVSRGSGDAQHGSRCLPHLHTLARFHAQSSRPFSYYAPRFKMFQTLGASKQCISQLLDVNGAYDATWKGPASVG